MNDNKQWYVIAEQLPTGELKIGRWDVKMSKMHSLGQAKITFRRLYPRERFSANGNPVGIYPIHIDASERLEF